MLGTGILKGLGVTFKHLVASYVEDFKYLGKKAGAEPRPLRRQNPRNKGLVTVEYPRERLPLPENFRYIPFLVVDSATGEHRCTSCGICSKVCPPQCIWIVRTTDPVTKRPVPAPKEFTIDSTICMNCGYCAEFCPFDAIKMDQNYELSDFGRTQEMILDKARLTRPDTYHAALHPTDWARELADKAAEEEKKRQAEEAKARAAAAKAAAPAPKPPAPQPPAQAG